MLSKSRENKSNISYTSRKSNNKSQNKEQEDEIIIPTIEVETFWDSQRHSEVEVKGVKTPPNEVF